jgi:Secretion system C-terminal sorting domain
MKIIFTSIVLLVFCINAIAQDPAYPPATAPPLNIVKAEYFIDNDPGFGMAMDIPLTAAIDIPNLSTNIDISALSPGTHYIIVRILNAEGQWSITSVKPFGIDPPYPIITPAPQNIVKAEYFIGSDPGFGLATDIPLTAALDIANLAASINITGLSAGAYNLYLRTLNAEGEWSITSLNQFGIDPPYTAATPAALNLVKAEYFIDTDTGFGTGTELPLAASTDISNLMASVDLNNLALGSHNLILRSLNTEGEWSITSIKNFGIDPAYPSAPVPIGNISRIEYFFDTDPGFGNGIEATISPATEIANLDITASLFGLTGGVHKFFIRSLDDWSLTSTKEFSLPADVLPLTLISFEGKNLGAEVLLKWKTVNEKNFSHFEVERNSPLTPGGGISGQKFEKIGNQIGNASENYEFLDSTPPPGAGGLYYRLRIVDLDGTFNFSKIIFIENKSEKEIVGNFYPSPSVSNSFIDVNAKESGSWKITTYDLMGKVVSSESKILQKGINKISIEKLRLGVNFVRFENGEISEMRKIIKEQ